MFFTGSTIFYTLSPHVLLSLPDVAFLPLTVWQMPLHLDLAGIISSAGVPGPLGRFIHTTFLLPNPCLELNVVYHIVFILSKCYSSGLLDPKGQNAFNRMKWNWKTKPHCLSLQPASILNILCRCNYGTSFSIIQSFWLPFTFTRSCGGLCILPALENVSDISHLHFYHVSN